MGSLCGVAVLKVFPKWVGAVLALWCLGGCGCQTPSSSSGASVEQAKRGSSVLRLVQERPIAALLSRKDDEGRLEASGVAAVDGHFYVVLDNVGHVARLTQDLEVNAPGVWQSKRGQGQGYEALAWAPKAGRFYAVIEAVKRKKKKHRAIIHAFTPEFELLEQGEIDFDFKGENKGVEGLAVVNIEGQGEVLVALCEAPGGQKKGKAGQPGLLLVLKRTQAGDWAVERRLDLPKEARFADFSDIAVDAEGRVAVVSQEDSAMWVGKLDADAWRFEGPGEVHRFPTDAQGRMIYCNVEGVSWLSPQRVVVVSDRAKRDQPARCRTKEQSVHIFDLL